MARSIVENEISEFIAAGKTVRIERAPFDHIETGAKLVILGITPGAQQMRLARDAHNRALRMGASACEASRQAKFAASFGGAMRSNLVRMLDFVGATEWIGLQSFAVAFDQSTEGRVHFTSALRYPVFVDNSNYKGQPNMIQTPLLREMIETFLRDEVNALPGAVWQPLGDKPLKALRYLEKKGVLPDGRIAPPLPHPSGTNAERIAYFLNQKNRSALSQKTNAEKIDRTRAESIQFYRSL